MIAAVGSVTAYLIYTLIGCVVVMAPIFAGGAIYERTRVASLAWVVGIGLFVLLLTVVFGPTLDALLRVSCRIAIDFGDCFAG